MLRVCLIAEAAPEASDSVPADEETARIEEVAVPASDVVEAAVAAAVPAAPEAAHIEEAAAPVTEVMVAVSADATPAEEEVSAEETAAPVIDVAAPVTEVVPAAPTLDVSAEAAAGLCACVCACACVYVCACVRVCECVCICISQRVSPFLFVTFLSLSFIVVSVPLICMHCQARAVSHCQNVRANSRVVLCTQAVSWRGSLLEICLRALAWFSSTQMSISVVTAL